MTLASLWIVLGCIFDVYVVQGSLAWAEVGDPCEVAEDCTPGEVCAPGRRVDDPSFCTRVCRADQPCPDGYVCESQGGLSLCNTEVILSGLGDPCDAGCVSGLLCLDDGAERYCSVACTLPGSCPEGYRCRPGALTACAKITSSPSIGEPCDELEGCLDPLECLTLPHRSLSYCTYACAERACPEFMRCEGEGEAARCVHLPYDRTLGDGCVADARDESLVGCGEILSCEPDGAQRICTQDCGPTTPCPQGFGCVYRPDSEARFESSGRCMPNIDSDSDLAPSTEPVTSPSAPDTVESDEEEVGDDGVLDPETNQEMVSGAPGPSCAQDALRSFDPRRVAWPLLALILLSYGLSRRMIASRGHQGRFKVSRAR